MDTSTHFQEPRSSSASNSKNNTLIPVKKENVYVAHALGGIHFRVAGKIIRMSNETGVEITIIKKGKMPVKAACLLSLVGLKIVQSDTFNVIFNGPEELVSKCCIEFNQMFHLCDGQ